MLTDDVKKLQATLDGEVEHLNEILGKEMAEVEKKESDAQARLGKMKERIEKLRKEKEELSSMSWANEKRLEAQKGKVEELHTELRGLREKQRDEENAMNAINAQRADALDKMKETEGKLGKSKEHQEMRLQQLTRGAKLYKKMGLEFEKEDGVRLRISFTQIDPKEPERFFSFYIIVDDKNVYHVERVEPSIGSISDLIKALNETNDFAKFILQMRCKFQELVK